MPSNTSIFFSLHSFLQVYGQPSGFHPFDGRRRHRQDSQQQNYNFSIQNSIVLGPSTSQNQRELLEKVNWAVEKARHEIIAAGECVTAWKVSQDAMLTLKVDSWSSLAFAMPEVPNLLHLHSKKKKNQEFWTVWNRSEIYIYI